MGNSCRVQLKVSGKMTFWQSLEDTKNNL